MPELEAQAAALAEDNGALGEALRDAQRELTEAGARRGEAEAELRSEADALRARADASADDLRRAREEANAHKLGALAAVAKVPGVGNTTGMGELDLQIVDIPGVAKHLVNFVSL